MGNSIQAVIFDWAGTTIDYGCMAPKNVFVEIFKRMGIAITDSEAREPMGQNKIDHIRAILKMPQVTKRWVNQYGSMWTEEIVKKMYNDFIPLQVEVVANYSELIPGILELQNELRNKNIKIGSTTGYNQEIMDVVTVKAAEHGYKPDYIVCSSDVTTGRPSPWMALKNASELNVYPLSNIIKVGDTVADIKEGVNACMWSVGVIASSNEMGLTYDEVRSLDINELEKRIEKIVIKFLDAGAHAVISTLDELPKLIDKINLKLNSGLTPHVL
ncbi:MAG: phosphonoacetaldehyde hydrolase [Ignavibacteriae bacterium]|nr:phosphonoacetaldehyde hydrolase [Ignavibacteriota bacterium]